MDSIPKYIACKHGREKPEYLHPGLEPILRDTFGVMTYQEDVMRIARELAGFSMGEADLLRHAMGKKIAAKMAVMREKFVTGAVKNAIDGEIAAQIFDQAAKFAGYGFNKGHAAAYAQVAYQTAFLKANFPVEFLAASMSLDIGNPDRLNIFRQEARRLGITVRPPDINHSQVLFSCAAGSNGAAGVIYYALAAVKNVGPQAMEHLVQLRQQGGPFQSIGDFAARIDPKLVNKRAFENLVKAGAFDGVHSNRRQLFDSGDTILSHAGRNMRDRSAGQSSLFGAVPEISAEGPVLASIEDWPAHERLAEEFAAVGFYLSGHPLDGYATALKRLGVVSFAELSADVRRSAVKAMVAGIVTRRQERRGKNGDPFAFIALSDPTGMFETMVFSEALNSSRQHLEIGRPVLLRVVGDWVEDELKLRAISIENLDTAAAQAGEGLKIRLLNPAPIPLIARELKAPGKGLVTLIVPGTSSQEIEIALPRRVQVNPQLKNLISTMSGVAEVESV
jgi:DNA polymerase-3 subunit alpha